MGFGLERRHALRRTGFGNRRLPAERRVVQCIFAIEAQQPAVFGQRQRVDFQELGIQRPVAVVEAGKQRRDRIGPAVQIEAVQGSGSPFGGQAFRDVHDDPAHRFGVGRGHFLDLHAAHGREQHDRPAARRVAQHRGIEFGGDRNLFLDQQALDPMIADGHAENVRRSRPSLFRRRRQPDAAGLAALAGRRLGLDDARSAERPRRRGRGRRRVGD